MIYDKILLGRSYSCDLENVENRQKLEIQKIHFADLLVFFVFILHIHATNYNKPHKYFKKIFCRYQISLNIALK